MTSDLTAARSGGSHERLGLARAALLVLIVAANGGAPPAARAAASPRPYDVLHYDADLDPDLAKASLRGQATVRFVSRVQQLRVLELDANGLDVETVEQKGAGPAVFEVTPGLLRITLAAPLAARTEAAVTITYRARGGKGLRFYPGGFYTAFDTQDWLPCNAAPDDRATASLRWVVGRADALVGSGEEGERTPVSDDRERRTWNQRRPFPAYIMGAASGPLRSQCRTVPGVEICSWAAPSALPGVPASLEAAAAAFPLLQGWAGVPYPGQRYDQVFVADRMAQELAGMAVIREDYLKELTSDPQEDWLIVHELAHSWWGNLITARSWTDFWLNEGMVTFIVAAVKERRWGAVGYEQEVALARRRYAKVIKAGTDRPLVFEGWSRPSEMGGAVTYSKGALVMNLLRRELGEKAFWAGMRAYSRAGSVGAVTSRDLQKAMQRASGRSLNDLFTTWVFPAPPAPVLVASHRVEHGQLIVVVEQKQPAPAPISLGVAVQTEARRQQRHLLLRGAKGQVAFRVGKEAVLSVRVDEGARLPVRVRHERPVGMLLAQVEREPDVVGRLEALEQLTEACGAASADDPGCAARTSLFSRLAGAERSALMIRELRHALDLLARPAVAAATSGRSATAPADTARPTPATTKTATPTTTPVKPHQVDASADR